jgi:hypothetical protein
MRRNCQPRLAIDIALAKVYIFLRTRVHNLNINALVCARLDISGDDDERVVVHGVPDAFLHGEAVRAQVEFYGERGCCCEEEEQAEREEDEWRPWS